MYTYLIFFCEINTGAFKATLRQDKVLLVVL